MSAIQWTDETWNPVTGGRHWRPTRSDVQQAYRERAKECHPDAGGSHEAMSELNAALESGLAEITEG